MLMKLLLLVLFICNITCTKASASDVSVTIGDRLDDVIPFWAQKAYSDSLCCIAETLESMPQSERIDRISVLRQIAARFPPGTHYSSIQNVILSLISNDEQQERCFSGVIAVYDDHLYIGHRADCYNLDIFIMLSFYKDCSGEVFDYGLSFFPFLEEVKLSELD